MRITILFCLAVMLSAMSDGAVQDSATAREESAIAAFRSASSDARWLLFRENTDNSGRSYLIHALPQTGVEPDVVIRQLERERDSSARRALILTLGGYTDAAISTSQRQPVVALLLRWYRDDRDAGIHSAIDWLLRHGRQGGRARKLDWRQATVLAEIDQHLAGQPTHRRDWFVTKEGQTMAVVRGPVEFQMGSPMSEAGRVPASDSPDEPLRRIRIPRTFAISTKEVTIAQFRRFLNANPEIKQRFVFPDSPGRMEEVLHRISPDDDGPQIVVTWYEGAMYCNWLSQQEGIAPSDWVYPASIVNGMQMPSRYLHRRGYRLPTEAEWEYAARADSQTSRFYGSDEKLLDEYAWYSKNPPRSRNDPVDPADPQRTWPVGQLKPNDLGLFDVYGNVWEWVQDRLQEPPASNRLAVDTEDAVLEVTDELSRVRRGGGFPYEAAMMRSAARGTRTAFPYLRRDNVGFRIARSY